jgi:hypothetical protein
MYSKIRNTLTAYAAAALFIACGWLLSGPAPSTTQPEPVVATLPTALTSADTADVKDEDSTPEVHQAIVLRAHRANRMNLSMPYFSFVQVLPQRRAD